MKKLLLLLTLICVFPQTVNAFYDTVPFYQNEFLNELTGNAGFAELVESIINGGGITAEGIFGKVANLVAGDVRTALSYTGSVLALVILASCIKGAQIRQQNGVADLAFVICYFVEASFLLGVLCKAVDIALGAAREVVTFIRMSLPAYIGIVTATGIDASASQGIFLIMVNVVSRYAGVFMINAFFCIGVLTVVSNMSSEIQIAKLIAIARQLLFWVLGFLLTVFAGMTALSGLNAAGSAAVGIRAAKYTIGHAIPVVGGFLADSTELILASAKIFKNAFGTAGIIIMTIICLVPVVKLFTIGFALKFAAGLTEPFCDKLMSDSIYAIGQCVVHIMVCILLMTVMFIMAFAVLLSL